MPHVSSRELDKETLRKLYDLLFVTITSRRLPAKHQKEFFSELLTHTEKIMLGKRLAAIALLARGATPYQTGQALKLSETTTNKLLNKLESGKFKHVIRAHRQQSKHPLTHYLENLLLSPLPPYGKSWWRHWEDTR